MNACAARLLALAEDVGRLRRQVEPDTYTAFIAGRVAARVDVVVRLHEPTAAELYQSGLSVAEALRVVDARAEAIERLLGGGW